MALPSHIRFAYLIEPPFNFTDDNGDVTGCDVELARHVLKRIGVTSIDFIETEFAELIPGLERGDWEMTTGLFQTPERAQHALFSRPIWALPDGILVQSKDANRVTGYKSFAGQLNITLAVIKDQVQHANALKNSVPADQIVVFDTYQDAADAISSGEVTGYASVAQAHRGFLLQNTDFTLEVVDVPSREQKAAFGCYAFAKDKQELKTAVDQMLVETLGSSFHRQLMSNLGFSSATVDAVAV